MWLSYPGISNKDCFSVRIDKYLFNDCILITIPISPKQKLSTELAHQHAITSPFFRKWLLNRKEKLQQLLNAINNKDLWAIAKLAEQDTYALHLITMTSNFPIVLYEEKTLDIMQLCYKMRANNIPVYFSIDTGPTIVLITDKFNLQKVEDILKKNDINNYINGKIAQGAELI